MHTRYRSTPGLRSAGMPGYWRKGYRNAPQTQPGDALGLVGAPTRDFASSLDCSPRLLDRSATTGSPWQIRQSSGREQAMDVSTLAFARSPEGTQPPSLYPAYASTIKPSPQRALIP